MIHPKRENVYSPEWADRLEQALVYLWNGEVPRLGRHPNICGAVCEVVLGLSELGLTDEITSRLREAATCSFFTTFYRSRVSANATTKEIQAARKAWMLDMIEEFRDDQNKV